MALRIVGGEDSILQYAKDQAARAQAERAEL
jgi:hypothetical protein